jgi:hypothetical protein
MYICHECGRDNSNNIPKAQDGIKSPNVQAQEEYFQKRKKENKDYNKFIGNTGEEAIDFAQRFVPGLKNLPSIGSTFAVGEATAYDQDPSLSDEFGMIPLLPAQIASAILLEAETEKQNMSDYAKDKYKGKDITKLNPEQEINNKVIDNTYVPKPKIAELKETKKKIKSKKVPYTEKKETSKVEIDNTRTIKPQVNTNYKPETKYKFNIPSITYNDKSFVMPREVNNTEIDNTYVAKPKRKNGGWLDQYASGGTMQEYQENYNDSKATASSDMVGDGFSNVGRNYSPAWGGQFEEGGEIPNAQKGKKVKPVYVESKNDPRYKAYNDSLSLYKGTKDISKMIHDNPVKTQWEDTKEEVPSKYVKKIITTKKYNQLTKEEKQKVDEWNKTSINPNIRPYKYETYGVNSPVGRIDKWFGPDEITKERKTVPYGQPNPFYKNPQQQVIVKPTTTKETTKPTSKTKKRKPTEEEIKEWSEPGFKLNSVTDSIDPKTKKVTQSWYGDLTRNEQALQNNLQPEGLIKSNTEFNADMSGLRPQVRQPKYYDIQENINQPFGGSQTNYRTSDLNSITSPDDLGPGNTRNITPVYQTGGSLPGSVGFTYARTKGIPSNGPYAKKTLASAQNGVDMYGNPITADLKYDQSVNRTNYNPRTNQMIFGNDMPYFVSQEQRDKTLAHENRHAWQFANDRTNFNIVHNPEYAFQDRLKKKPEHPSTEEVFENYHDRKRREVEIDIKNFKSNYPELSFMPDSLIYKKFVDPLQYNNPSSVEGEAQYYENTGERSFQNGGEMKFYQNGLDFKPKSISRDGGWLDQYDVAQNGKKKFKLKDERLQAIRPSESTFVKKPNFEAEQAKVRRTYVDQVGKQMAEEKRRKKLTKEQREREDYNARNEQTGSIQTPVEESTWDRTKAIVSNPLTAFGYAARNESLPTRFQHGDRNTLDYAVDWINPLQGAAALSEIPGELGRGEFLNAGLSALDAADLGVYARGAKQLKNINPEGKIFNGLNKQLDDIAIKNTEKYMAKRTPSNTPLSKEMNPQLLDNFDPGEYTPFQEDDYMKWFNEQRNKLNPRSVKQDPRSILRRNSIVDINDMKEGGVIKDDMGQWKYPGQITEIGSNQITMEGVPYDVLGISDTGDTKLMEPGKNYKFKGKKVTEFPMAKNGLRQEQKGLQNLEDLTNFTNYNKPSNWLNKYN